MAYLPESLRRWPCLRRCMVHLVRNRETTPTATQETAAHGQSRRSIQAKPTTARVRPGRTSSPRRCSATLLSDRWCDVALDTTVSNDAPPNECVNTSPWHHVTATSGNRASARCSTGRPCDCATLVAHRRRRRRTLAAAQAESGPAVCPAGWPQADAGRVRAPRWVHSPRPSRCGRSRHRSRSWLQVQRTVKDQALVAFRGNYYSVPPGHTGLVVQVRHRLGATSLEVVSARGSLPVPARPRTRRRRRVGPLGRASGRPDPCGVGELRRQATVPPQGPPHTIEGGPGRGRRDPRHRQPGCR